MDPLETLMLELARLPSIGERSATRLAFYLVKQARRAGSDKSLAKDLARALNKVVDEVRLCVRCQNFASEDLCRICRDPRRDGTLVCVVQGVADLRAVETTGVFSGVYFVLHGAISPLDGVGPDELRLPELVAQITQRQVVEVVLATNADVEGDATALYIATLLAEHNLRVSRLASGIPMGGELEYLDGATLGRAFAERRLC